MSKNNNDPKLDVLKREGTLNPRWRRVKDKLFVEKDFFDPRDIVQVKYEMLRRVRDEGQSVTRASESFGFSRLSFYQAQRAFEEAGLPGLVPGKRGPRGAHKLTGEVMAFVERRRKEDGSLLARDLAALVEERFGVVVHPRTIERRLSMREKKGL